MDAVKELSISCIQPSKLYLLTERNTCIKYSYLCEKIELSTYPNYKSLLTSRCEKVIIKNVLSTKI